MVMATGPTEPNLPEQSQKVGKLGYRGDRGECSGARSSGSTSTQAANRAPNRSANVVVDRVAHVPGAGGLDAEPLEGMMEDGRVRLGETDLVTVDDELEEAIESCPGKRFADGSVRVGRPRPS